MNRARQPLARRVAALVGVSLALVVAGPVVAHVPWPAGNKTFANGATTTFKWTGAWDASVQPVQDAVSNVLTVTFADPNANNSNTVTFVYSSTSSSQVKYTTSSPVCDPVGVWYGCADATNPSAWIIWIKEGLNWCDLLPSPQTGCVDAGRVTIHESQHIAGYLKDPTVQNPGVAGDTRMTLHYPHYNEATWNAHVSGRCDEARFQLMYDVNVLSGPYADCFDHITNAGVGGLKTVVTASPGTTFACSGAGISVPGRISVAVDSTNYGALSGNNLASRTVWFDRSADGGSTWTTDYSSASSSSAASGNNWTKGFSATTSGTVTYTFRAHFKKPSGQGLAEDYSPNFDLTWSVAC